MPIKVNSGSVTQTITPDDDGGRQESVEKPYKNPEEPWSLKLLQLLEKLQTQEMQAGKDCILALRDNEDQTYWASCGRQAAYRHAINLVAVMLGNPSRA
jgi:hypothetical protein